MRSRSTAARCSPTISSHPPPSSQLPHSSALELRLWSIRSTRVAAFALALPVVFAGAIGPIVTAVLDAPTPPNAPDTTIMGTPRNQEGSLMPPEFAGFGQAVSTLLPVILSALGVLPILAMRVAPNAGTVARSSIGVVLVLAVLVMWIRRRDHWSVKIRSFFAEGRAAQQAGRPS